MRYKKFHPGDNGWCLVWGGWMIQEFMGYGNFHRHTVVDEGGASPAVLFVGYMSIVRLNTYGHFLSWLSFQYSLLSILPV